MSDDYKKLLTKSDENPCMGLSKGDSFMVSRLALHFKNGDKISYAYAALKEVSFMGGQIGLIFDDVIIKVEGQALDTLFENLTLHRALWIGEGDSGFAVGDGEFYISRIKLEKFS